MKKAAGHISAVIKGILFIGFSIQIIFGVIWMCSNFAYVQDFGEPESALYAFLFGLFGEIPQIMYLLQLALAFLTGYAILQKLCPVGRVFGIWRALALLTFPFAMQCHLAVQPYSIMGSLFLWMLLFLIKGFGKKRKLKLYSLGLAAVCAVLFAAMSGAVDLEDTDSPAQNRFEASLASRLAWPSLLNDFAFWSLDLQDITEEALWEATFCPGNMDILLSAIEEQVTPEQAKEYYLQIARVGWVYRAPMIIRQVGWDVLGYTVTPLILPLQLEGEAYDSYTGRNYENMRGNTPLLTGYYVEYGCWWFGCCLGLCIVLGIVNTVARGLVAERRKSLTAVALCILASGVLVALLTLRGAGLMDYRWTIAVNELWLVWALLLMGKGWKTW